MVSKLSLVPQCLLSMQKGWCPALEEVEYKTFIIIYVDQMKRYKETRDT